MLLLPGWDFHGTLSLCSDLDDSLTRRSWVLSICVDNFSDQRHSYALHPRRFSDRGPLLGDAKGLPLRVIAAERERQLATTEHFCTSVELSDD